MTPGQIRAISQGKFEEQARLQGNTCFHHRFFDTSDLMNRGNRGHASLPRSPADYLVTINSKMFYAEVKGTTKDKFPLSRIEPSQWAGMMKQHRAGGDYFVFIWSIPLSSWMLVPGKYLLTGLENKLKSFNIERQYDDWTKAFS